MADQPVVEVPINKEFVCQVLQVEKFDDDAHWTSLLGIVKTSCKHDLAKITDEDVIKTAHTYMMIMLLCKKFNASAGTLRYGNLEDIYLKYEKLYNLLLKKTLGATTITGIDTADNSSSGTPFMVNPSA